MSTDTLPPRHSVRLVRSLAPPAAKVTGLHKSYGRGASTVPVLRGVDLTVQSGELLAIVGQSGSGKSTLLHLMAALDVPDRGQIELHGQPWDRLTSRDRDRRRNRLVGIIFQFYHLLPELTACENVLLPQAIGQGPLAFLSNRRTLKAEAWGLLERVGMSHRAQHRPRELSGGEMQRVAVARALMARPRVLLADEPTGNLDRQTGVGIIKLLRDLNVESQLTIVLVTHDRALADQCDRSVELVEGCVKGG